MRIIFHLILFFGISLGLGFGLSYLALEQGAISGTIKIGPWISWKDVGSTKPDPYTRAYMSRNGALELARAEGFRFVATHDSDGQPLRADCNYRLNGTVPRSAFWTLQATAPSGASIAGPDAYPALQSSRLQRNDNGSFTLFVGPDLAPKNWLSTQGTGAFSLVLTLYDTTIFSEISTEENLLPSIRQGVCS